MGGTLAVKMPGILPDVFVVGFPLVEMTKEQVMVSALDFTQREQIVRVKLQMRVKVEGLDMMDLQPLAGVATGHTSRLTESMLLFHSGPLGASFMPKPPGGFRSMVHFLEHGVPLFEPPLLRMVDLPNLTPATSASESPEHESCEEHSHHYQEMNHEPVPKCFGIGLEPTGPWHQSYPGPVQPVTGDNKPDQARDYHHCHNDETEYGSHYSLLLWEYLWLSIADRAE